MLVKVDTLMFLVDFIMMNIEEDREVPLILSRPFMKTNKVIIDVDNVMLKVRVQGEEVNFNVFEAMKHPTNNDFWLRMDMLDGVILSTSKQLHNPSPLERTIADIIESLDEEDENEIEACLRHLDSASEVSTNNLKVKELHERE